MCLHTEMTEAKNASFQRLLQIIIAHAFNAAGGILVNPLAIWQNIALALFIGHWCAPCPYLEPVIVVENFFAGFSKRFN